MKKAVLTAVAAGLLALAPTAEAKPVRAHAAATCADHDNQAEAQRAKDTRDADGDGIYCESLPCPCSTGSGGSKPAKKKPARKPGCSKTGRVVTLAFSKSKYPNIRAHYIAAVRAGWPRILVVNRGNAERRRARLMRETGMSTRSGYDRDEYPPAVGRGRGSKGLRRGANPTGWQAHLAYVRSSENRSHGATMGNMLRRWCNGQKFRYSFR